MLNVKEFDVGQLMVADFAMRAIHADLRRGRCDLPGPPEWLRRLMTKRLTKTERRATRR